jgi:hypothetical protein
MASACKSCGAPILWRKVKGKPTAHPCDPEPVTLDLTTDLRSLVAWNPVTERALILRAEHHEHVAAWVARGVELYRSHFSSCPNADEHRRAS